MNARTRPHTPPDRRRQAGLTLVEIMVAMVLSLVLLGGVIQIFASTRQTHRVQEAVSRMQESGRMALEFLARDIRMADFWGCASSIDKVTNHLDSTGTGFVDYAAGGIGGTEGGTGGADSLILRGGFNSGLTVQSPYGPLPSAVVKVNANNNLQQGDVVFVSDCTAADIFQITNADPDTSGNLVHNTGSSVTPGNINASDPACPGANAHCLSKVYGADATVYQVQQLVYSIQNGAAGQPALFRNGQEIVDGIEDLQILYGEDLDARGSPGFGTADYYVPANQVVDMERVVSIRVAVVVRSYEDNLSTGAQNYTVLGDQRTAADNRLRQVYSDTVAIRNRLP